MTVNDLAFAMVEDKDDIKTIKQLEDKIKSWEDEKSYPALEDIYNMAYIININPGELLAIRNRCRKQFYKESGDPPIQKHDWIEISENASIIFSVVVRFFVLFVIIVFSIWFLKFVDTFFGKTGGIVEDQVMLRQIQKNTDPENIINDGTVENMVKRIKKEANEKNKSQDSITDNVTNLENENDIITEN